MDIGIGRRLAGRPGRDDLHVEGRRKARHLLRDLPEPEQAQGALLQRAERPVEQRLAQGPTLTHFQGGRCQPLGMSKDHRHHMLGDRPRRRARGTGQPRRFEQPIRVIVEPGAGDLHQPGRAWPACRTRHPGNRFELAFPLDDEQHVSIDGQVPTVSRRHVLDAGDTRQAGDQGRHRRGKLVDDAHGDQRLGLRPGMPGNSTPACICSCICANKVLLCSR